MPIQQWIIELADAIFFKTISKMNLISKKYSLNKIKILKNCCLKKTQSKKLKK
jgi:hypothetical protein